MVLHYKNVPSPVACFVRLPLQLRIHESRDVDFYVLVASGPIIEDCGGLRFAPAGLRYPEYQQHLQVRNKRTKQVRFGGSGVFGSVVPRVW